jgi:hypothetical protein
MYYFSNLEQINKFLMNNKKYNFINHFCFSKYKLFFLQSDLRIEKFNNNHIFDYTSRLVGSIDLKIKNDEVLIISVFINNRNLDNIYGLKLSIQDSSDIKEILMSYARYIAFINNKCFNGEILN